MINKIHFGKRIASHRRALGISQSELANQLGVTSQAVSKWECGSALPDIDLLLVLSKLYSVTINDLLEPRDIIAELANLPYESADGIAYFVSKEESPHNLAWAREITDGGWISRNWEREMTSDEIKSSIAARILAHGGRILEIGAGPGGGFMPAILKCDPDASIMISDLSPTVVREWKRFLDRRINFPNLGYAVFNFCDMPFRDESFDVISDGGGIGNIEQGSRSAALREVCRTLKPDGIFVTSTGFITRETLAALPETAQKVLKEKRPDIFEDLYEDTVLAGFSKIESIICGGWDTDGDDSTVANLARSLGVNLHFTSYVRFCRK